MPFSGLAKLAHEAPLRVLLLDADEAGGAGLSLAGLAQPWRRAQKLLGAERLQMSVMCAADAALYDGPTPHVALLVADDTLALGPAVLQACIQLCRRAQYWGAAGAAVLWLVRSGQFDGARAALPWSLYAELDDGSDSDNVLDRVIVTPNLYEIDGNLITCCGGAASLDFALGFLGALYGAALQSQVQEALCVERVRGADERQRVALQARFGATQPKLSEAVMLMEANIEEPLSTDEIAQLVGLSRRQLERLFKQYLGTLPSRYYLELRLHKSRQLLIDSHHSIVQVGLMCGFSSGSHFSTAFGTLFGMTPREQRQRRQPPGGA
ncbi:MAG TPA: helix-turn-helix domain-containing protein [Burkholderiaceae bacterium]